jgi:hypothetical protein
VGWLHGLEKQGFDFVRARAPDVSRLTIGVLALVAEQEQRDIPLRTRGLALGGGHAFGIARRRPGPRC